MPSIIVYCALKKSRTYLCTCCQVLVFIALYASGGTPFRPGLFSIFEFVDCSIYFVKGNGSVDVVKSWLLWDLSKNGVVNRSVVVKNMVKVRSKHHQIFFAIGCKYAICHLHCHLNLFCVMNSSATSKKADILPRNMWIQNHIMNF